MTGNLPSPSGVGLGILQLTQGDDYAIEELAKLISADPALSGRIIKLANSAMVAGSVRATDVLSASRRLGVRSVRSVALGFSLISANRSGICTEFDYARYWSLSLSSAVLAQSIAGEVAGCCPSEAFTCSLLSRVGMLALASVHPERYSHTLRCTRGGSLEVLLAAESGAFDITHAEVTLALFEDWRLPKAFGEVAISLGQGGRELEGLPAKTVELLSVVNAAWMLAPKLMSGATIEEADPYLATVAETSELDVSALSSALTASVDPWSEWKVMLNLADVTVRKKGEPVTKLPDDGKPDLSGILEEHEEDEVSLDPLVMIVDDDERIIRLVTFLLKKAGFRFAVARDGKEALLLGEQELPEIIITDWMMPEMTGVELCAHIKRSEALRHSYVIMLTAEEAIDSIEEGFAAGADDYVCKPFSGPILIGRVQSAKRALELQVQLDRKREVRTKQMAKLSEMTNRLRSVTMTDALTKLPNRRFARRQLIEEWNVSVERDKRLSLGMIDIDNFKRINDTYGHDVGDHVLRMTGLVLRDNTRKADFVCRFGGEEFLLINIDCTRETALQCCERLRAAVEANHIEYGGFSGNVTISLGVAERKDGYGDVDSLLKAADQAVYRAKRLGRNRVDEGGAESTRRSA